MPMTEEERKQLRKDIAEFNKDLAKFRESLKIGEIKCKK